MLLTLKFQEPVRHRHVPSLHCQSVCRRAAAHHEESVTSKRLNLTENCSSNENNSWNSPKTTCQRSWTVSVSESCVEKANQVTINYQKILISNFGFLWAIDFSYHFQSKNRLSSINGPQMYFSHNTHGFYNDSLECIISHSQQEKREREWQGEHSRNVGVTSFTENSLKWDSVTDT